MKSKHSKSVQKFLANEISMLNTEIPEACESFPDVAFTEKFVQEKSPTYPKKSLDSPDDSGSSRTDRTSDVRQDFVNSHCSKNTLGKLSEFHFTRKMVIIF